MIKLKYKTTETTRRELYSLRKNLGYEEVFVNDVLTKRFLTCPKDKISPIYTSQKDYLKTHNPFNSQDYNWFDGEDLPEDIEDLDESKVILCKSYDHTLYDVDLNPLGMVMHGDYIDGGVHNGNYDLEGLLAHLKKHADVVYCKIEDIPYYNRERGKTEYVEFTGYVPDEVWVRYHEYSKDKEYSSICSYIFGEYGGEPPIEDYFGIWQFKK